MCRINYGTQIGVFQCKQNVSPIPSLVLQSILESLDELLFPPEWRSLFTAAGLPDSTLDDVGSTRILISLVSQVMAPQGDRPCGVPPLQLSDNDSDDEYSSRSKNSGSPTRAGVKSMPTKMVTESMSQDAVDEMDFMYVNTNRTGGATHASTSLVPQIDVSAEALATPAASTCFDAPPAPPPLLTFDTSRAKPKVSPKPTKLKPSVVRESFLDELKAGLNNLSQRPRRVENNTDNGELRCHQVKGTKMADIRQSMLLNQRGKLKPTINPHPNQLHNLKDIGKEQLNSLTEIIRKVGNIHTMSPSLSFHPPERLLRLIFHDSRDRLFSYSQLQQSRNCARKLKQTAPHQNSLSVARKTTHYYA